ncbi:hypothetical protein A1O3_07344 [Capronia epimyces CBS 606.96]|uniref:Aminoglycoside phosphotransferase domain-containing protein n=1 Tax=Capronia epimyces CBS 606.96 TaxID=1182542 RepID=W9XVM6_9EURO|nr:uncharacterized protein A1O3_07344 [Capronia epimyces CBS 606.96]EXJ81056.1 hypothetical protein A1O3_07344 [Capronia epimyces CBS 606.96]
MDSTITTELKRINQSQLPNYLSDEMDFLDTSFFKIAGRKLPCPQQLGASREGITVISEMQLVIKFGQHVTIDEAVTMWVVRKYLGHQVPVPKLFGWRVYQGTVYIYMELIAGVTLEERWKDMDLSDKASWLEWLPQRFLSSSQRYKDPYLTLMPKDTAIKFTHADVHPTNIIVSTSGFGPARVLALIDWGQSGWYPDYWEYFKICYTTHWEGEWRKTFIPKMIEPQEDEKYLMDEYTATIGAV